MSGTFTSVHDPFTSPHLLCNTIEGPVLPVLPIVYELIVISTNTFAARTQKTTAAQYCLDSSTEKLPLPAPKCKDLLFPLAHGLPFPTTSTHHVQRGSMSSSSSSSSSSSHCLVSKHLLFSAQKWQRLVQRCWLRRLTLMSGIAVMFPQLRLLLSELFPGLGQSR